MNYDIGRALRIAAGQVLLAGSRALARVGARLVGHPAASTPQQRPPLRVVRQEKLS